MKITLEIERIGSNESIDPIRRNSRYECRAQFEHDYTSWSTFGTSIGETLLNMIELIRPTIAQKLPL